MSIDKYSKIEYNISKIGVYGVCICKICNFLLKYSPVIGSIISVFVFAYNVTREKRILTIKEFSKIRNCYREDVSRMEDDQKIDYLRDLEFFCLGINKGIYNFQIFRKMSGKRLYIQYDEQLKPFIKVRRDLHKENNYYCEYEKVMKKLSKYYKNKNKGRDIKS